jgi:hypothetical protein
MLLWLGLVCCLLLAVDFLLSYKHAPPARPAYRAVDLLVAYNCNACLPCSLCIVT